MLSTSQFGPIWPQSGPPKRESTATSHEGISRVLNRFKCHINPLMKITLKQLLMKRYWRFWHNRGTNGHAIKGRSKHVKALDLFTSGNEIPEIRVHLIPCN